MNALGIGVLVLGTDKPSSGRSNAWVLFSVSFLTVCLSKLSAVSTSAALRDVESSLYKASKLHVRVDLVVSIPLFVFVLEVSEHHVSALHAYFSGYKLLSHSLPVPALTTAQALLCSPQDMAQSWQENVLNVLDPLLAVFCGYWFGSRSILDLSQLLLLYVHLWWVVQGSLPSTFCFLASWATRNQPAH
jgi:hypothetical protein